MWWVETGRRKWDYLPAKERGARQCPAPQSGVHHYHLEALIEMQDLSLSQALHQNLLFNKMGH